MMDQRILTGQPFVVQDGMKQDRKTGLFSRGNRDTWYAKHFREAVQIDLHAAFFHDIHHVECKDDRLSKLDELQSQIQVALQGGSVRHIYDDIDIAAHDAFPGNGLFHRVGS